MTDFSPDMQQKLDALNTKAKDQHAEYLRAEKNRLENNKNRIDSLARDAKALGLVALARGVEPYTSLYWATYSKGLFGKQATSSVYEEHKGWALTVKSIQGKPYGRMETLYDDSIKPTGRQYTTRPDTHGLMTLLGVDCNLYVVETEEVSRAPISETKVLSDSYEDYATRSLRLAPVHLSVLEGRNPGILDSSQSEFVLLNIDTDAIAQGLLTFAERKHLY